MNKPMEEDDKDVKDVVDPAKKEGEVENTDPKGDDKSKNFASLRKKLEDTEKELSDAKRKLEEKESPDRSLTPSDEEEKEEKGKKVDTLKVIFDRDVKEATRVWNKTNKVSTEEWAQIKSKVRLSGDETQSEIQDKIQEAYEALPGVREKRDKALIEKGKRMAMGQFSDEELDVGGGGDIDLGERVVRVDTKTKSWGKALGLSDKEIKEVDTEADPNEWTAGPQATRKFFTP